MIEFDDVSFRDLEIPHLKIPEGVCAVFGPNGSGKSTFLKLLSGMELPEKGSILIDGSVPRKTESGYLSEFPDKNILFERVADEIASPLKFRHTDCSKTNEIVNRVVEKLGITHLYNKNIKKLSGGEKVLVELATAIVADPDLLILDEPDSHLDPFTAGEIFGIITELEITHVVFCTQNMERAGEIAGYAVYMEDGRVAASGTPASVFEELKGTCFYPENFPAGTG
ncbi:ABC transporter related protein [Methanolacinia petrolearia DSM 11571]|uniref:ABC transporter related protein n=1 Tax=Methanolacinia petrolearia (strain DSM 11571 / OCM 486 / SEBR 4847) TaxID=679926 RepID=E1RHS3_METP4|nr:energy-coupling factor ABC transporter ATP-binding protein [Methanolacinia petrolearia]ADN36461.1 ABC transporter related protein [Methanolacinia petrolearia DSM 11571]